MRGVQNKRSGHVLTLAASIPAAFSQVDGNVTLEHLTKRTYTRVILVREGGVPDSVRRMKDAQPSPSHTRGLGELTT